jgi:hypothetical protein
MMYPRSAASPFLAETPTSHFLKVFIRSRALETDEVEVSSMLQTAADLPGKAPTD